MNTTAHIRIEDIAAGRAGYLAGVDYSDARAGTPEYLAGWNHENACKELRRMLPRRNARYADGQPTPTRRSIARALADCLPRHMR